MNLSFVSILLLLSLALATPTKPKLKSLARIVGPSTVLLESALPSFKPKKLRTPFKRVPKTLMPTLVRDLLALKAMGTNQESGTIGDKATPTRPEHNSSALVRSRQRTGTKYLQKRFNPPKSIRRPPPTKIPRQSLNQELAYLLDGLIYKNRNRMLTLVEDLLVLENMGSSQYIKLIMWGFVATWDDLTDYEYLVDLLATRIPGDRKIISAVVAEAWNTLILEAAVVHQKLLPLKELLSGNIKYRAVTLKHLVESASMAEGDDESMVNLLLDRSDEPADLSIAMDLAILFNNWRTLKEIMKDSRAKEHIPRIYRNAQFYNNVPVIKAIKEIEAIKESGKAPVVTSIPESDAIHQEAEEEMISESE